jgi:hypothetical protein
LAEKERDTAVKLVQRGKTGQRAREWERVRRTIDLHPVLYSGSHGLVGIDTKSTNGCALWWKPWKIAREISTVGSRLNPRRPADPLVSAGYLKRSMCVCVCVCVMRAICHNCGRFMAFMQRVYRFCKQWSECVKCKCSTTSLIKNQYKNVIIILISCKMFFARGYTVVSPPFAVQSEGTFHSISSYHKSNMLFFKVFILIFQFIEIMV